MKTVSGVVLSSKPVSLYKAARVLSKFVASDNGASPAFTAYLKRASASFDELVQLRKELKGSVAHYRGKKKSLPDGNIAEETVNSVKKPGQDGLYNEGRFGVSGRKEHNMGKRDEVEAREVEGDGCFGIRTEKRNSEGNVGRDSVDVRGGEKKMKKQRGEGGEIELIIEKERSYGDLDAVDANGIKDDGGSKETKKKKKRDKGERGESDNALKKEDQDGNLNHINGEATDVVENGVGDGKKHKKYKKGKEERESGSTGVAELMDISNGGSENSRIKTESNEGKQKKRSREEKEKESGIKVEVEEADNKESRKRKHKRSGHGGLDDSEEQHRSKKKSRKNEVCG